MLTIINGVVYLTNGNMHLKLLAVKGRNAAFARLNADGSEFDYIIGKGCSFDTKNRTVSWCFGSYPMHHNYDRIIKQLGIMEC